MGRSAAPFWLALALLAATLAFVRALPYGREGLLPASLETFPSALGEWRERTREGWSPPELPPTASETLFRVYGNGQDLPVTLYVAYWKRQGPGEVAFRAHHAAPGREWTFVREELVRLSAPSRWGAELTVNRALYQRSGERQLVTYWFIQPGRRVTGSRYWGGVFLLWDYVTRLRSDVALIRVATRANGSVPWTDFRRHEAFIRQALPALERYFTT